MDISINSIEAEKKHNLSIFTPKMKLSAALLTTGSTNNQLTVVTTFATVAAAAINANPTFTIAP